MTWHVAFSPVGKRFAVPASAADPATLLANARYPLSLYTLLSALCPGAHTGDPVHRDVRDIPGRRAVHGRETDIRSGHAVGRSIGHVQRFRRPPSRSSDFAI